MGVDTEIGGRQPVQPGTGFGSGYVGVAGYSAKRQDAGQIERYKYNVPTLTALDLAQILYQAGFRGAALTKFIGIALRESAMGGTWIVGRPDGGRSGEWSFGIFGLNTKGSMWDEAKRLLPGLASREQLLNPVVNARLAFAMYQKYGERPWGPYKGVPADHGVAQSMKNAASKAVQDAMTRDLLGRPWNDQRNAFNVPAPLALRSAASSTGVATPPVDPAAWAAPGLPASTGVGAGGGGSTDDERFTGYGGGAVAANVTPAPLDMTDDELRDFIRTNYGYMSAYFDDAEIGPILREAARGGWSRDKLYGRLSGTTWWKNTADAGRKWEALIKEDHATADRMNREKQAEISNVAGKAGLAFTSSDLINLADAALRYGWSDEQLHDSIRDHLKARWGTNGPQGGDAGHAMQVARQAAASYMVPVSDAELQDFALRWVGQETSAEDIDARMAARARAQYAGNPDLIALLDKGVTLSDAFSAHRGQIARLLEVSPETIDLTDPAWQGVLQHATPAGMRAMSITEAGKLARQSEKYMSTDGARRALVGATNTVKRAMGL